MHQNPTHRGEARQPGTGPSCAHEVAIYAAHHTRLGPARQIKSKLASDCLWQHGIAH